MEGTAVQNFEAGEAGMNNYRIIGHVVFPDGTREQIGGAFQANDLTVSRFAAEIVEQCCHAADGKNNVEIIISPQQAPP